MAPGDCLASPPPSMPLWSPEADHSPSQDHSLAHYRRLEHLLDSALATLTLIRDAATPAAPAFTLHMTEVLQALCRHALPTPPPLPSSPTPPPTDLPPKNATYAQAAHTATEGPERPKAEKPKASSLPPSSARPEPVRPDLIFRFDLEESKPPTHPPPSKLFIAIEESRELRLGGVRWTQNGNLAIQFPPNDKCMPKQGTDPVPIIWKAIRPLLGFPKRRACPRIDNGSPWHSVVVHDVPIVKNDPSSPHMWLETGGFTGRVESISVLCSDDILETKKTAPIRLSLSSRADAEFLVTHGALLFGSRCRVSHYVAKPRGRQQSPQS
ncbi:hypothetical protein B0H11DRAFT_1991137 [Mycena galericulata]|nr:hypothetical protein B0H11DRAFT_1991137 [Mycena galericulata]